jgi:hypothetical protein
LGTVESSVSFTISRVEPEEDFSPRAIHTARGAKKVIPPIAAPSALKITSSTVPRPLQVRDEYTRRAGDLAPDAAAIRLLGQFLQPHSKYHDWFSLEVR